jgi:hypothetical protein
VSLAPDHDLHPLTDWLPRTAAAAPVTVSDPRPADTPTPLRVLVRFHGDPTSSATLLACVVKLCPAATGSQVLLAVRGVREPTEQTADALLALVPLITDDRASLPDMELVADVDGLDETVDVVVEATGAPSDEADTVLGLVRYLAP